jgi:hypothetical protein
MLLSKVHTASSTLPQQVRFHQNVNRWILTRRRAKSAIVEAVLVVTQPTTPVNQVIAAIALGEWSVCRYWRIGRITMAHFARVNAMLWS